MTTMPSVGTATARGVERSVARSVPVAGRRRGLVRIEVGLAMLVAAATALAMTTDTLLLFGQLGLWGALAYRRSAPLSGPALRQVRPLCQALGAVLALTSLGIALGL